MSDTSSLSNSSDLTKQKVGLQEQECKKAKEALRESEAKYQTLVNCIDQGYFIIDVIFDENDKPIDMYYVESNAAATRMLGLDYAGKHLRQIDPNYEAYWYEIFGQVAKTGKSTRLQRYAEPNKKWYDFYVFKIGGPESRRVGNIFLDITERKKAEEALYYQANLLSQVHEAVLGLDGKENIRYWNKGAEEVFGYTAQEVMGKNSTELLQTKIHAKSTQDEIARLISTGHWEGEASYRRKDGKYILTEVRAATIKDEEGQTTGIVAAIRDITEHEKVEEQLKTDEEQLRAVISNSPIGIAISDSNKFFLSANAAFCRILGYSEDELKKRTFKDFTHPQDVKESIKLMDELSSGRIAYFTQEKRYIRKDNAVIYGRTIVSALRDKEGRPTLFVVELEDISERKRAEQETKAGEARLKLAQRIGHMGSWEFDVKEGKALWSEELFRIFGLSPQTYGPDIEAYRRFIHPDDLEAVTKIVEPFTFQGKLGEAANFDYRIVLGDGSVRVLHTERVVEAVDESGKPSKIMGIEQDITERKKIELELEQYSKHLEELVEERSKQLKDAERLATIGATAGMVGHDIRNPLQAITNELYLTKESVAHAPDVPSKSETLDSINFIQEQVNYIDKIVSDLQDYAKVLKPGLVEVDICKLVPELLKTVAIPANIQATAVCQEHMPLLRIDPSLMRRILTNLVINSVQAMPNGGKLTVGTYKKDDKAFITVEDTGAGIPDEVKSKLFTPLFTTKAKGQGFGLVVVKRMVEALGGTISFESEVGKGTKFIVELPAK